VTEISSEAHELSLRGPAKFGRDVPSVSVYWPLEMIQNWRQLAT